MKWLVVTADDFGLSEPVNEAVELAHREGILSAASLMAGAPAFNDAVARARRLPSLGVGLHVTLTDGRPVLPPKRVPGLVGADGRFRTNPAAFGVALYFSPELRRQVRDEIAAQFVRFASAGLSLDHVNAHQHFHLHPVVAEAIADFAASHGAPPVRVPEEPFRNSYAAGGDRPVGRAMSRLFFAPQTHRLRQRFAAVGLATNDQVFGLVDSGAMTERRLLGILDHVPEGVTEIYCHPATRRWTGPDSLPPDYEPEQELAALTSAAVLAKVRERGLELLPFRAAAEAARAMAGASAAA